MCETTDTSPLLSPQPNTHPMYHAFSNYITHLNAGGPGGPPACKDVVLGRAMSQWGYDTSSSNTIDHSCYKPVKQVTLTNPLQLCFPK